MGGMLDETRGRVGTTLGVWRPGPDSAPMADDTRGCLLRQFETAWALTSYHLEGLSTEECLWRPARAGLHVQQLLDGRWRADWSDRRRAWLRPLPLRRECPLRSWACSSDEYVEKTPAHERSSDSAVTLDSVASQGR